MQALLLASCRRPARRAAAAAASARAPSRSRATASGRATASRPGRRACSVRSTDSSASATSSDIPLRRRSSERNGSRNDRGEVDVLEHGQLVEHRRLLERAADAGAHDRVLLAADELLAVELDRAARRAHEVRDRVDQRRLAGAVGPDDEAHLVLVRASGRGRRSRGSRRTRRRGRGSRAASSVMRPRLRRGLRRGGVGSCRGVAVAVRAPSRPAPGSGSRDASARSCSIPPATPFGRNRITTTNSRPCRYSQPDGNCSEMLVFAQLTMTAPAAAHASTVRPPSATQMTISIDGTMPEQRRRDDPDDRDEQRAREPGHAGRQRRTRRA